jgi:hypothetical protein
VSALPGSSDCQGFGNAAGVFDALTVVGLSQCCGLWQPFSFHHDYGQALLRSKGLDQLGPFRHRRQRIDGSKGLNRLV